MADTASALNGPPVLEKVGVAVKLIVGLVLAGFLFGGTAAMADECADRAAALSPLGAAPVHRTEQDFFLRLPPFTRIAVACWPWGVKFEWRTRNEDPSAIPLLARASSIVLRSTEGAVQVAATSCLSRAHANADRQGSADYNGLHVVCGRDRTAQFVLVSY